MPVCEDMFVIFPGVRQDGIDWYIQRLEISDDKSRSIDEPHNEGFLVGYMSRFFVGW